MFCEIDPQEIKEEAEVTPLIQATFSEQQHIIEYLIEKNVNLSAKDFKGMTALDHAFNFEIARTLIKHGATHGSPFQALLNALYFMYNDVVDYLLDNNLANIDDKDENGRTALHIAAGFDLSKIEILIYKGADVNAKDDSGSTPLIKAAKSYRNEYEITDGLRSLLNHNADLEAKDLDGMTALHWAVKQGLPDVVELLVEKNANTEAMDNNGKTPLDLARERVDFDQAIVDCLTRARQNG